MESSGLLNAWTASSLELLLEGSSDWPSTNLAYPILPLLAGLALWSLNRTDFIFQRWLNQADPLDLFAFLQQLHHFHSGEFPKGALFRKNLLVSFQFQG
jgi:hypothetical protein